jgi:hypothetical protein
MGEEPDPAATPDPPAADPGALEPMASRCVATVSPADTWESRGDRQPSVCPLPVGQLEPRLTRSFEGTTERVATVCWFAGAEADSLSDAEVGSGVGSGVYTSGCAPVPSCKAALNIGPAAGFSSGFKLE